MATNPMKALKPQHPLPPPESGTSAAHCCFRSVGSGEALVVEDGGSTATVKVPVTAAVPVTLIPSGFGVQCTPGGKLAAGHVTLTMPVKPPVGVTVLVEGPLLPVVAVAAVPLMVNEPELETVTVMAVDVEAA